MKRIMNAWWATLWLVFLSFPASSQSAIKVACMGNSVTFGLGLKNREQTSYPSVLQTMLGAKYEVKNFGHSGATLLRKGHRPYCQTKEFKQAIAYTPDIALIDLGLNDTDPRNWPNYRDEFAGDYAWLIDTLRKANPQMQIFICKMTPIFPDHPRFKSGTRDWFWQIQQTIENIAKANNTGLVDLHSPLYKRPDLFADALHPNEEGAAIIAKTIYQKLSGDYGGLQLPLVFASHMVLQQKKPVKFWGTANRGEKIFVSFGDVQQTTVADDDGQWSVNFSPLMAGGPYRALIQSPTKKIALEDILVGEVWLCSGQSNMAFPLSAALNNEEEMLAAQNNSGLRLLQMKPLIETNNTAWDSLTLDKANTLDYFSGTWERIDSNKAKAFSAVAYYFARQLQKELSVPVGLIQVAVGGSPTESWIDRYTLEHHPVLVNELTGWRKSDFFQPWVRERADTNLKNSDSPKQRHPYDPAYNYEAGIVGFTKFPIQGVIWYQGESNAHNIELHEVLFPTLVKSWRHSWGYEFPFYYVQLSSLDRPSWTSFRNSQLKMLKQITNSGMAVSSDAGDSLNVHPKRKKEVGERLARLALHFTYGKKTIVPYGPMPLKATRHRNEIVVSFAYANVLKTSDAQTLRGFECVDEKGVSTVSRAFIRNNQVIIPVNGKKVWVTVRYGWKPYTDANLVNETALPASTFQLKIE